VVGEIEEGKVAIFPFVFHGSHTMLVEGRPYHKFHPGLSEMNTEVTTLGQRVRNDQWDIFLVSWSLSPMIQHYLQWI
jgi:hypothetical protein